MASLSVPDRAALGSFGGLDYFGCLLGIISNGVATDLLQVAFRSPVEVTGAFLYNLDDLIGGVDPLAQKLATALFRTRCPRRGSVSPATAPV